jgi:hypothetical protein
VDGLNAKAAKFDADAQELIDKASVKLDAAEIKNQARKYFF